MVPILILQWYFFKTHLCQTKERLAFLNYKLQTRRMNPKRRYSIYRIGFSCEDTKSRNKHFSTSKATQRTLIPAPYLDTTNLTEFPWLQDAMVCCSVSLCLSDRKRITLLTDVPCWEWISWISNWLPESVSVSTRINEILWVLLSNWFNFVVKCNDYFRRIWFV